MRRAGAAGPAGGADVASEYDDPPRADRKILVGERPNVEAREHGGPAVVQHRCGSVVAAAEPIGHAFGDDAVEAGGEQSEKRPCIFSRERLVKPAGGFERLIRHGRPFPGHLARRPSAA
jgi:hypothetical protein